MSRFHIRFDVCNPCANTKYELRGVCVYICMYVYTYGCMNKDEYHIHVWMYS